MYFSHTYSFKKKKKDCIVGKCERYCKDSDFPSLFSSNLSQPHV